MGKARLGRKELNKIQEFRFEIQRLKRENDALRKRLARIDLDKRGKSERTNANIGAKNPGIAPEIKKKVNIDDLKLEWACHDCNEGHLELVLYNRVGDLYYYRKCNKCEKRTKSQKYTEDVKGIMKK